MNIPSYNCIIASQASDIVNYWMISFEKKYLSSQNGVVTYEVNLPKFHFKDIMRSIQNFFLESGWDSTYVWVNGEKDNEVNCTISIYKND